MEIFVNGMAESMAKSGFDQVDAQHGHHGTVVGAQFELRHTHLYPMLGPDFQQFGTKLRIRGEATSYNQRLRIVLLAAAHRLLGEYSRHGIRQRRAHVIDGNLIALRLLFLDPTRDGRFHAGNRTDAAGPLCLG